MAEHLDVLIVEDSEDDARLIERVLRKDWPALVAERVETAAALGKALEKQSWDCILCDMVMPGFSAAAALKIVKQNGLDLPFIVVSGVIGMEDAVELMRAGAHDFVRKDDLARLVPAVRRELKDAETRRARKRAEEALSDSELRLRTVVDTVPDAIVSMDRDGRISQFNPAAEKMFGRKTRDAVGRTVGEVLVPDESRDKHEEGMAKFLATGGRNLCGTLVELDAKRADGTTFPIEMLLTASDSSKEDAVTTVIRDITERKRAEEALRRSEERFRDIAEAASDWFWEMGPDLRFTYHSDRYFEITGFRPEDKIGTSRSRYVDPADLEADAGKWAAHEADLEARRPFKDFEYAFTAKDGGVRHVRISGAPFFGAGGEFLGYRGTGTDITERKRAEEELRESEARAARAERQLLDAVESIAASFVLYDADERLVLCNSTAREFLHEVADLLVPGARFEDLVRARLERTMPAAAAGRIEERVRGRLDRFRHPGPAIEEHHADGRWTQVFERRTADGGTVCIRTDITEFKRAEEKLHTLSRAVEQSPAAVIITDTDGTIEYVNQAFTAITGYTRQDAIGRNPRMLESGQTPETTYERLWATVTAGKTWHGIFHNKRKDGIPYLASASVSPITTADGTIIHYLGAQQDVTERVEAEKRLRRTERMEALGDLAGGIAHDFNNLLLPIMVLSQMTMVEFPRESAVRERMEKVVRAAESARDLVARILLFAREEEPKLEICEICVVVRQAMELMVSLLPATIKIKENLDPNVGIVSADATQIETVLLNLASNAADAMMGKPGELELSLSRVEVGEKLAASVAGLKAGAYAMLSVADSGHGMDDNTMDHLFDPFFTTKQVGKGTGLGLSTVHGIVTRHGGAIDVSSMPGLGSRFDIYLPLQKRRKTEHRPKKSRKRKVARMTE